MCERSQCKHGGTCVAVKNGYSCICNPDYQSTHCELGSYRIKHLGLMNRTLLIKKITPNNNLLFYFKLMLQKKAGVFLFSSSNAQ